MYCTVFVRPSVRCPYISPVRYCFRTQLHISDILTANDDDNDDDDDDDDGLAFSRQKKMLLLFADLSTDKFSTKTLNLTKFLTKFTKFVNVNCKLVSF